MIDAPNTSAETARFFSCLASLNAATRADDQNATHEWLMELGGLAMHARSPLVQRRAEKEWEDRGGAEQLERCTLASAQRGLAMAVQYVDLEGRIEHASVLEALAIRSTFCDIRAAALDTLGQYAMTTQPRMQARH